MLFLLNSLVLALAGSLTLVVTPNYAPEPSDVKFRVRGLAAPAVCFILDGPNYFGTCRETEGRANMEFTFKNVPYGRYVAAAYEVECTNECKTTRATQPIEVVITKVGPE